MADLPKLDEVFDHIKRIEGEGFKAHNRWIECEAGWNQIILEAHRMLLKIDPNYKFRYAKEKWSHLAMWAVASDQRNTLATGTKIDQVLRWASDLSERTCEKCGSNDVVSCEINGWEKTLCNACVDKVRIERNMREQPPPRPKRVLWPQEP